MREADIGAYLGVGVRGTAIAWACLLGGAPCFGAETRASVSDNTTFERTPR